METRMNNYLLAFLLAALLLVPAVVTAQSAVKIEKVAYKGWPNCYRMTDGQVEVIVTSDVGPRVIGFGFVGGDNEFKEFPDQVGKTGGSEWVMYGGHRLWHAPEGQPRSYSPDNSPIEVITGNGSIRAIQPTEPTTRIQKQIEVRMAAGQPYVEVVHRLTNHNLWAVELAPWAMSMMATGGRAIIPLPPRGTHPQVLDVANPLAMWAYTDLRDPRWTLGFKYISLRQDPKATSPQKIGVGVPDGWAAYYRNGHLFVKRFAYYKEGKYPDFGASVETFTNAEMLELETLAPLTKLQPGSTVEYTERWYLFKDVKLDSADDASIDRAVLPLVHKTR